MSTLRASAVAERGVLLFTGIALVAAPGCGSNEVEADSAGASNVAGSAGASNVAGVGGLGQAGTSAAGRGGSSSAGNAGRGSGGSSAGKAGGDNAGKAGDGSAGEGAGGEVSGSAGSAGAAGGGAIDCRSDGDGKTTLVFVNGCAERLTFRGSDIEGGTLDPGAFRCVDIGSDIEELSAKRYWGFRGEDPGAEHHTLAEFTFNTDFNDFDWYNISHVDAFNLPMQIVPVARDDCKTLICAEDFVPGCPDIGKFEDDSGELVACVSPDRNDGDSEVALYFEQCDDAYAWSGDDQNGDDPSPVRACAGEDWDIVFCPEGGR